MLVLRTAMAVSTLAMSVPALAQGRWDGDRGRVERRDDRQDRGADRGNDRRGRETPRAESRNDNRRDDGRRDEARNGNHDANRDRGGNDHAWNDRRDDRRDDRREDRRDDRRDFDRDRWGRGRAPVVIYRPPPVIRYDRRGWDDDRRGHESFLISGWFRGHGGLRLVFGDRWLYDHDRYVFRRGLILSPVLVARLDLLPFDLEFELGRLPYPYERRIYGRTVLVIDMRSGYVVDVFDIDD